MILALACGSNPGGTLVDASFVPLPTRPMHLLEIDARGLGTRELESLLRERLAAIEPDAVVQLRIQGNVREEAAGVLRAASLRALAPPTMTVSLAVPRWAHGSNFPRGTKATGFGQPGAGEEHAHDSLKTISSCSVRTEWPSPECHRRRSRLRSKLAADLRGE
jgi:hypothetical protein